MRVGYQSTYTNAILFIRIISLPYLVDLSGSENKPGALFRVLEPFESFQLSLTKIETRPSKKEAWEYVFFIDFVGHVLDEATKKLFATLVQGGVEVKVLGSYPLSK